MPASGGSVNTCSGRIRVAFSDGIEMSMRDDDKSKERLIAEVRELRRRLGELEEAARAQRGSTVREATAQAFFECAAEGIVAVNRDEKIVLANPRAEAMFGYERAELAGQLVEMLIPDHARHIHGQHQADYFAHPRTRSMGVGFNLTGRRKDGAEFPIEISLTFVPGEDGGLAIAFVTDISERVAEEQQARRAEKLAALGSLAAGIAHEINNPIGIILSRIELMLVEGDDREGTTASPADLHVLHRHAQRLGRIAQGLLSFGQQRQQERRPIDVTEIVEEVLLFVGKQLSRDGIHVVTVLADGPLRILGDATALEQVLLNLILNARDAMPAGGALRIEVSRAATQPDAIRLAVSDTGCGMPPEVLARLAEPFFTAKPMGTGLGLSVSYRIIREHGGTVDVRSEPNRGTTFTVIFPTLPGASSA